MGFFWYTYATEKVVGILLQGKCAVGFFLLGDSTLQNRSSQRDVFVKNLLIGCGILCTFTRVERG